MTRHTFFRNLRFTSRGFTLIELLIVIAVIGLLAGVVLIALDPIEQTAKARDTSRLNTVVQLGRAMQTYASVNGGSYPAAAANWQTPLVTNGDIKSAVSVPAVPGGTGNNCATIPQNNICYSIDANGNMILWTVLESKASKNKPTSPCTNKALLVYSSLLGKAGIMCHTGVDISASDITSTTTLF